MPENDYISRESAKLMLNALAMETALNNVNYIIDASSVYEDCANRVIKWLDLVPAADVVEVVRCSVCKYVVLEATKDGKGSYWCPVYHAYRCYDEFCNRGERITE